MLWPFSLLWKQKKKEHAKSRILYNRPEGYGKDQPENRELDAKAGPQATFEFLSPGNPEATHGSTIVELPPYDEPKIGMDHVRGHMMQSDAEHFWKEFQHHSRYYGQGPGVNAVRMNGRTHAVIPNTLGYLWIRDENMADHCVIWVHAPHL